MQVGAKYSNEQCPNARLNTVMVRKKKIIIRKGWMVSTKLKKIQSPTETGSAATQNLACIIYKEQLIWTMRDLFPVSVIIWQGRMMHSTYQNVCWDQIVLIILHVFLVFLSLNCMVDVANQPKYILHLFLPLFVTPRIPNPSLLNKSKS